MLPVAQTSPRLPRPCRIPDFVDEWPMAVSPASPRLVACDGPGPSVRIDPYSNAGIESGRQPQELVGCNPVEVQILSAAPGELGQTARATRGACLRGRQVASYPDAAGCGRRPGRPVP